MFNKNSTSSVSLRCAVSSGTEPRGVCVCVCGLTHSPLSLTHTRKGRVLPLNHYIPRSFLTLWSKVSLQNSFKVCSITPGWLLKRNTFLPFHVQVASWSSKCLQEFLPCWNYLGICILASWSLILRISFYSLRKCFFSLKQRLRPAKGHTFLTFC